MIHARFPQRALTGPLSLLLVLAVAGPAGAATRIGPDLALAPAPAADCGAVTCSVVGAAGPAMQAGAGGVITRLHVRHGATAGGDYGDRVSVQVLDRAGDAFTVVAESAAVTLPASGGSERTDTVDVRVPVQAGQWVGLRVQSGWAGDELTVLASADGSSAASYAGNHPSGTASYATADGMLALYAVDVEPDADGDGYGDETQSPPASGGGGDGDGSGDSGGSGGSPPADQPPADAPAAACPAQRTSTASALPGPKRLRGRGWPGWAMVRGDNFDQVDVAFDRRGRAHVAGRGTFHQNLVYAGPGGARLVAATQTKGAAAIAIGRSGQPVLLWGQAAPDASGPLIRWCPALWAAAGPGMAGTVLESLRDGMDAFVLADVAADPRTGALHQAFEVESDVYVRPAGQTAQRVDVPAAREIRLAAGRGGRLALGVLDSEFRLTVLAGRGGALRKAFSLANVRSFDVAVGSDGRPRVAVAAGTVPQLSVFNGRRLQRLRVYAEQVGVAVGAGNRIHVGFSLRSRPSINRFGAARNGIFHLGLDRRARRGRIRTVQPSVGYSPARIAVAARGRRVAIAYGDPGKSGQLTLRVGRG